MCQVIRVATLKHETFELLEEQSVERAISRSFAEQIEQSWEQDASEYEEFELSGLLEAA